MSNQNRDEGGRFAAAQAGNAGGAAATSHTPPVAANAGGSGISASSDPAQRGAASNISDGSADNWGGPSQTDALLGTSPSKGGGMAKFAGAEKPVIPDYEAGYNKLGFVEAPDAEPGKPGNDAALRTMGRGSNEAAGMHTISAPGGRAGHGGDIGGSGTDFGGDTGGAPGPGPRDWSPAGGAGDAAEAGGLGDLGDLAAAAI